MQSQKRQNDLCSFPRQTFNITVIQVYAQTSNAEEAEDIKKRWQEYIEKLYKKDLHDPDNHDGVITHLEPDIHLSAKSRFWPQSLCFFNTASPNNKYIKNLNYGHFMQRWAQYRTETVWT